MPTGCEHGRSEEDGCEPCEAWIDLKRENAALRATLEALVNDPSEPRLGQLDWKRLAREALSKLTP